MMKLTKNGGRQGVAAGPIRLVLALVVLTSTVSIGALSGTLPASAHGLQADGCTGVPDSGYGFSFHGICDRHDRCYRTKPYGTDSADRRRCDRVFRSDMLGYCTRHSSLSTRGIACRSVAVAFYSGVRTIGHPFWARGLTTPIA